MFLLSMVILGNNLTFQTGETVTTTNTYGLVNGSYQIVNFTEVKVYDHTTFQDDSGFFTTHNFGYLLAIMSVLGMIGSFMSIKPENFMR